MNVNFERLIAFLLENALNAYLSLDPDTAKHLRTISGKVIVLELTGLNVRLLARPLGDKVHIGAHFGGEPDVVICGSVLSLARLGLASDTAERPIKQGVEIRGDAEVGRIFREVLSGIEIDWEEFLAARMGDIPAHQVGNLISGSTAWLSETVDKLSMDLSEYLQEEVRIVPTRVEVEQFMDEIDLLRADIDRLEARLERLQDLQGSYITSRAR
jgi:ubiquinone biosynthesis protein UbiJ